MRVHLGSDHAGWELKEHLAVWLRAKGHEPVDHGPYVFDAVDDYPPFCLRAAEAVLTEPASRGVVVGGSGNGEQIAANKVLGVRAVLAWSRETAELGRLHNDANVMSVGARMHSTEEVIGFLDVFLSTEFTREARHERRIAMLTDYEQTRRLPELPATARRTTGGDEI
jgi:ribose 5-phosphate isomerase B